MYLQSGTYIYMPYDTRCHMAWANIVNPSSAMICNDNHGSQDYRDVPSFFCHCKPRLFHRSKPSETSLTHLDWVMHCPSFCVVEAFVKGRWTTSPILHVRWSLTPGVSHCKCVRGLSFFFPFLLVYIIKGPYKLVILLLKHVPLSTVSSKSEAPGTPVHLCIQY